MKNIKFFFLGLLCMNMFLLSSCGSDDEDDDTTEILSIVETAQATDDLSLLVDALVRADLVATLNQDGPFTVFAPNNAAFQALLDGNDDWSSIDDIPVATLETVLLYHVLGADVKAADLTNSYVTTAATGPNDEQISLQIDVDPAVTFNGSANPLTTDIETTNGTVHIINEVMLPPSVVNHALNNPQFSTLVAALTRSDHTTDFVDVLSGDGPFTVFAPNNLAFAALLNSNDDWNSLDDIPVETLDAVLRYHVISGTNAQSGDLSDNQTIPTFQGADITIDLTDGVNITTGAEQSVPVGVANVQGSNGVVHEVTEVMLFQ